MLAQKSLSPGSKQQSIFTLNDKVFTLAFLVFCLGVLFPLKTYASTLAEEFFTDTTIKTGSLVSLSKDSPKKVELSTMAGSDYLLGVVTASEETSVTYSKNSSQVSVALSGEVDVYVTDVNGSISKGDFIGVSWLEGVAMKADISDKQKLLGVALEDYDTSNAQQYGEIDTPDGKKDIAVGSLRIRIFERDNSEATTAKISGIEGLLSGIAGKNVSLFKIVICLVIFALSLLIAGFFVSSSIKGSFISIGRNPLASSSIYRSLVYVTGVSVAIILIGTALAYVVLAV